MAKKVRAKRDGFYGGSRYRAGAVFDIDDKIKLGGWMEEVKTPAPKPTPAPVAPTKAKSAEVI